MSNIAKPKIDEDALMRLCAGALPRRQAEIDAKKRQGTTISKVEAVETPCEKEQTNVEKRLPKRKEREAGYEGKYLRPLGKDDAVPNAQRACICIPERLHATLKRLCNLVFDGKVSMAAFVTNVLTDHIDTYRDFYDTLYKPKSWNE